jgi:hypothetical protein
MIAYAARCTCEGLMVMQQHGLSANAGWVGTGHTQQMPDGPKLTRGCADTTSQHRLGYSRSGMHKPQPLPRSAVHAHS